MVSLYGVSQTQCFPCRVGTRARPDPTRHTTKATTHHMYSIGRVLLSGLCGGSGRAIPTAAAGRICVTLTRKWNCILGTGQEGAIVPLSTATCRWGSTTGLALVILTKALRAGSTRQPCSKATAGLTELILHSRIKFLKGREFHSHSRRAGMPENSPVEGLHGGPWPVPSFKEFMRACRVRNPSYRV